MAAMDMVNVQIMFFFHEGVEALDGWDEYGLNNSFGQDRWQTGNHGGSTMVGIDGQDNEVTAS